MDKENHNERKILTIKNLSLGFTIDNEFIEVVDNVSFHINRGECLGLVGESGCGKSVTAMSTVRLLPIPPAKITNGEIIFDNKNLLSLSVEELRKIRGKEIGFIFQEPMTSLNPVMKIKHQVAESLEIHYPQLNEKELIDKVISILKAVGIPSPEKRLDSYPHELSGGMRQRIMIAIAMICNPKLLIADEPTTALDVTIQAQILDLIKQLQKDFNASVLLITHDMGVIAKMCDRVIVMYAGRIIETADVNEIFENPTHPYTKGLLNSIPSLTSKKKLETIPGSVPNPKSFTKGCRFRQRCKFQFDKCQQEIKPPVVEIKEGHTVTCWLFDKAQGGNTNE